MHPGGVGQGVHQQWGQRVREVIVAFAVPRPEMSLHPDQNPLCSVVKSKVDSVAAQLSNT